MALALDNGVPFFLLLLLLSLLLLILLLLLLLKTFYQCVHFSVMYTAMSPERKPIKYKNKVIQQKHIKYLLTIYNLKILC